MLPEAKKQYLKDSGLGDEDIAAIEARLESAGRGIKDAGHESKETDADETPAWAKELGENVALALSGVNARIDALEVKQEEGMEDEDEEEEEAGEGEEEEEEDEMEEEKALALKEAPTREEVVDAMVAAMDPLQAGLDETKERQDDIDARLERIEKAIEALTSDEDERLARKAEETPASSIASMILEQSAAKQKAAEVGDDELQDRPKETETKEDPESLQDALFIGDWMRGAQNGDA